MNIYDVYMEGFITNGNRTNAQYVGIGVGENFMQAAKDACIKAYGETETKKYFTIRNGVPMYWGCSMYDNMADASRRFG